MKRFGIAVLLAALGAVGPIRPSGAAPTTGCQALAIGSRILNCVYEAEGPGTFIAVSLSGWKIRITHDDQTEDVIQSVQTGGCSNIYKPEPESGPLPTVAGDVVSIEVQTACLSNPPIPQTSYQVGLVIATEANA